MSNRLFFAYLILCSFVLVSSGIHAQSEQQKQNATDPNMIGPPRDTTDYNRYSIKINSIAEMPGISLRQRLDLSPALSKEQEKIDVQIQKKELLYVKEKKYAENEKKKNKIHNQKEKIDNKILKYIDKTNKKVKRKFTDEQYQIFIDNRAELLKRNDLPMKINNDSNIRPRGDRPSGGRRPGGFGGGGRPSGGGERRM